MIIAGADRRDEIWEMSRAVGGFRVKAASSVTEGAACNVEGVAAAADQVPGVAEKLSQQSALLHGQVTSFLSDLKAA